MSEPVSHSNSIPTQARLRRRRVWLFRLDAIALPLCSLIVVEIGLRVLGYGHDTRLIVPVTGAAAGGTHRIHPHADRAYFRALPTWMVAGFVRPVNSMGSS